MFAVRAVLYDVCCLSCAVRCSFFVVGRLLFLVWCCPLFVVCCVVRCVSSVGLCFLFAVCCCMFGVGGVR